jgi:hypothetical protein
LAKSATDNNSGLSNIITSLFPWSSDDDELLQNRLAVFSRVFRVEVFDKLRLEDRTLFRLFVVDVDGNKLSKSIADSIDWSSSSLSSSLKSSSNVKNRSVGRTLVVFFSILLIERNKPWVEFVSVIDRNYESIWC